MSETATREYKVWLDDATALGRAWAEAEAALPDGANGELRIGCLTGPWSGPERYWANAWHIGMRGTEGIDMRGDTPAAALQALAARLRQHETPQEDGG